MGPKTGRTSGCKKHEIETDGKTRIEPKLRQSEDRFGLDRRFSLLHETAGSNPPPGKTRRSNPNRVGSPRLFGDSHFNSIVSTKNKDRTHRGGRRAPALFCTDAVLRWRFCDSLKS